MLCLQYHPRGLQLYLGTAQQPHQLDTLVMSNLGYFQLKAAPGVWDLQLAPGQQVCFFCSVRPRLLLALGS